LLDHFCVALIRDLKHSGVSVSCLLARAAGVPVADHDVRLDDDALMRGETKDEDIGAKYA
jgi:hypothetical protein